MNPLDAPINPLELHIIDQKSWSFHDIIGQQQGRFPGALRDFISVKDPQFNAIGDGVTDDTAAIQAAITAMTTGGVLNFPVGDYKITTRLSISASITLQGSTQYVTSILCVGCSGVIINKNNNVQIKNIEFAASVRHTTTPNTYIGIEVTGDTVNRPFNHIYRDVYIDGFKTAFESAWLWASVFDNFRCKYGTIGIKAKNLSVSNAIINSIIAGDGVAAGRGIWLDGSSDASEGWTISNTVVDVNEIGIYGTAQTHIFVSNCIIDHNTLNGILIAESGANFGGNWTIIGNYIAMTTAGGDVAIKLTNTVADSQNRGCHIAHNQLLVYAGMVCPYGIYTNNTEAKNNVIIGNTIKGFSTNDIRAIPGTGGDIISGNVCQSAIAANIRGGSVLSNNVGAVLYERAVEYAVIGTQKITWDEAAPLTGTWSRGDWCMNVLATSGGPPGWACTVAGSPGTWKAMANLA